jgi:hypothetical protein
VSEDPPVITFYEEPGMVPGARRRSYVLFSHFIYVIFIYCIFYKMNIYIGILSACEGRIYPKILPSRRRAPWNADAWDAPDIRAAWLFSGQLL